MARCAQESTPVKLIFLESICDDARILENNYHMKLANDDYKSTDAKHALEDFKDRVHAYERVYEPITDEEGMNSADKLPFRYMQIINAGRKFVTVECQGLVMSQLLPLLHSITLKRRKLSIVLAGESENDDKGVRGGDSALSRRGREYAMAVCNIVKQRETAGRPANVLTGTLKRYSQLADMLCDSSRLVLKMKALDELCFGSLEGLPGGLLRHSFPEEHAKRSANKLYYRYPGAGGESYMDVILRLRDIVLTIERAQSDYIVVCDVAVARILLGYFQGTPTTEIPDVKVTPGIIELTRSHSGFIYTHLDVNQGSVSILAES